MTKFEALTAYPVFYRTYSRQDDTAGKRETWDEVVERNLAGLTELGKLTPDEIKLLREQQLELKSLPSGRWLWVGGTDWSKKPENFPGGYNCSSTSIEDIRSFGLLMDLAMQGCGTGAILEDKYISQLPEIKTRLYVDVIGKPGDLPKEQRREYTSIQIDSLTESEANIFVGDSRQGWVNSYQALIELAAMPNELRLWDVNVDVSSVRPSGEKLRGFGGTANPIKLMELYPRVAEILNGAVGRKLTPEECCLLIDEAAIVVVAGNVRRSAGMRQFDSEYPLLKLNLWQQDDNGNWRIDPKRDALRMANHTRVFHTKPSLEQCIEAVRLQYQCGEGAIQWAGEAVARANADILNTPDKKAWFLKLYQEDLEQAKTWLKSDELTDEEVDYRFSIYGFNPCVTADTWVHTGDGPRQVKDLIGKQHSTYVNGELFSTTAKGFFLTGTKEVVRIQTKEGFALSLTPNHQVLKVTAQTQKKQYTEWVETSQLSPGDKILLHNHRDLQPWDGEGTYAEGWLMGSLIGDGSLCENKFHQHAILRYWQESRNEMSEYARDLLRSSVGYRQITADICEHKRHQHKVINSRELGRLAYRFDVSIGNKTVTEKIEKASYEFYRGFLQGFFDADGSVQGTQQKGVSVRLSQSNLATLEAVQRMLARLGIISTVYKNRRDAGFRLLPDSQRNPKLYKCQAQHDLVITQDNLPYFKDLIGFREPKKQSKLDELLSGYKRKFNRERFAVTVSEIVPIGELPVYDCTVPGPSRFDANGFVAHNCGEILLRNNMCNLSEVHLNQIDPFDFDAQEKAFKAAALSVAALLHHKFTEARYQRSRELDPIVGVSFTGLFDFFVKAFGVDWLRWWEAGRPKKWDLNWFYNWLGKAKGQRIPPIEIPTIEGFGGDAYLALEASYLTRWRQIVEEEVWKYCDRHGLKRPNRCTTVQPAGTKSLLTGASPGWHPPKAARFIRRITFGKNDPVALACYDYGYSIVPSQSDKDENGNLLNDPFDPRCTEWLVEIPVKTTWADLPGADTIDISKFSALAQFDFYMQVQKYYTRHNTSATIEMTESEIEPLGTAIYQAIQNDDGYISAALLARFDDKETYPRMPFEPIDKERYQTEMDGVAKRNGGKTFEELLARYSQANFEVGPAGCDSDKCLFEEVK